MQPFTIPALPSWWPQTMCPCWDEGYMFLLCTHVTLAHNFVCLFFQQFFNLVSHQTTLQCRHNRVCRLQEEIETGKVWRGSRQGPQMVSNTAQSSEKPQSGLWFYLYSKGKILQNLKKKGAMVMSICVVCSKEGGESRRCFL